MQQQSVVPRKRIHNPRTGKYYALRVRSSSKGRRGTIKGLWKPPKKDANPQSHADISFNFYRDYDEPLGVSVQSLKEFKEQIPYLDAQSLEFHFLRGDFEAWLHDMGASRLAQRVGHIELGTREQLSKQLLQALK
jgi:hypothetical protein